MNKTPRFISLMADTTAKALIKDDHHKWFYEDFIKFKTLSFLFLYIIIYIIFFSFLIICM